MRTLVHRRFLLAIAFVTIGSSQALAGNDPRVMAHQTDEQIVKLVERLKTAAQKSGFDTSSPAVDLFRNVVYDQDDGYSSEIVNLVRWIVERDDVATADFRDVEMTSGVTDDHRLDAAFVWRLDAQGKVTRWNGLEHVESIDGGGRRIRMSVDDVQPGDVLGLSVSHRQRYITSAAHRNMTTAYPVVLFQADLESRTDASYEFSVQNLEPGDFKTKVLERRDGIPIRQRLTATRLVPPALGPHQLPPEASVPSLRLRLAFSQYRGVRERVILWNQIAHQQAYFWHERQPGDPRIAAAVEKITAGATTTRERADQLYRWTRDQAALVAADAGPATFAEMIEHGRVEFLVRPQLLATLLMTAGLPTSVGHVRPTVLGSPSSALPAFYDYPIPAVITTIDGRAVVYQWTWMGHPSGEVGAELAGALAVRLELLSGPQLDRFAERAGALGISPELERLIREQDWSSTVRLPATTATVGQVNAVYDWEASGRRADASLDLIGPSHVLTHVWTANGSPGFTQELDALQFLRFLRVGRNLTRSGRNRRSRHRARRAWARACGAARHHRRPGSPSPTSSGGVRSSRGRHIHTAASSSKSPSATRAWPVSRSRPRSRPRSSRRALRSHTLVSNGAWPCSSRPGTTFRNSSSSASCC